MAKQQHIWEVQTSDGIRRYYWDKAEADFAFKDAIDCGFAANLYPIPVPQTPKDFCGFMERQFAEYRPMILAAKKIAEAR